MGRKVLLAVPVLMFLLFLSAGAALAVEEARGVYPNGAEDCYAGCLPPPGTYLINYNTYQWFGSLRDNSGHHFRGPDGSNLKADTFVTVFRFVKGTGCKILGADWYWHVLIPFQYLHISSDIGLRGSTYGVSNITFNPIILGWHFGDWHFAAGVDINTPAPSWDSSNSVFAGGSKPNIGTGYWNVEPILAFTYLNKGGFEFGAKFMYDYNWENWNTNYQTGQEIHVDAAVAQKFKNGFLVSLVGFYYMQLTKDEFHPGGGVELKGTEIAPFKGKAQFWGIGPMVRYDYKNMFFLLKWYHEMDAKNTVQGDALWFKFFYAF